MNILTETEWRAHNNNHITRARRYTDDHLARRKAGTTHPIFDFLFEYYPIRISRLHRWHPGIGIGPSQRLAVLLPPQWGNHSRRVRLPRRA